MKMTKRLLSLLVAVMLLVSAMDCTAFSKPVKAAESSNEVSVSVENSYASPGSTVDVNIELKNNPGILGATLKFTYDRELTLVSASSGEAFSSLTMTKPGKFDSPCQFVWDGQDISEKDIKDGVILTLTFEVGEAVELGKTLNIDVSYNNGDVIDKNLDPVKVQTVSGKLTVINYTPGDLNNDGMINTTDVILLRRYIAGGYAVTVNESAADVNEDGKSNTTDVILLRRYIAGGYGIDLKPSRGQCSHSMEHTARKDASCTEAGNIEYWHCGSCDKYFSDREGISEISLDDTLIEEKGHTVVIDSAVLATNTSTGLTEGSHCSVCNTVIKKQEVIPMLESDQYQITYYLDDNDSYLQQIDIKNGNSDYYSTGTGLKLSNPKVDGYIFEGWYDAAGASGTLVKEIPAGETGDKELYARWTPVKYTVKFDSPLVPVESVTYSVDQGATLTNPEWFGYTFVGWSDDEGNIVKSIKPGTTGNITLHANWTSKRNQTIPVSKLGSPIIEEDEENGRYLFAYEIGRIENVPLYTIKDFGNRSGITVKETTSTSGSISETSANTIAEMISNATTRSSSWTLSEEWNSSTTISEEHSSEVGSEVISTASEAHNKTGKWNISSGNGGEKTSTTSSGVSSKISAELSAKMGAGPYEVSAKMGAETSVDNKQTESQKRNWNVNLGYESAESESKNSSVSNSLSKKISDKQGYSQTQGHNVSNSSTSALATSQTNSREYASSLSYAKATTNTTVKEYSNEKAPEGYYRLVSAGTVHVFAVVGYDIATRSYFTYTYNVLDDEVKDFIDYSKETSNFDDYENGVLPFEVPYFVNEYIDSVVGASTGLVVDPETGKIVRYTGTAENVVVPRYMTVKSGSSKDDVVKITGFEAEAFAGNSTIKSVKFSDQVKEIPDEAFKDCTALESISCPSVKEIGKNAFDGCKSLEEYVVKSSVVKLGTDAFKDVPKVTVNAANADVFSAAVSSGAKKISIHLASLDGTLENKTVVVSDTTEIFELQGNQKTYKNISIQSAAKTTIINGMNFENEKSIPLKISSENVTLSKVTASAPGFALVLSSDHTNVSLYGTVSLSSEGENTVLCKNLKLDWANQSAVGKLKVTGNVMAAGTIEDDDNLCVSDGEVITIDNNSFDQLMQDSLEWVLASEVPDNARIVSEKWKYKLITQITSSTSNVPGYTLYKTTSEWGNYGAWSGWSNSAVSGSSSRQVETRTIPATYKTQYNYSRWASKSNNTGNLGPVKGTWSGVYCQYYFERGWSDSPLAVSGTQYSSQVGGNFNLYGNNQWFNQSTRSVVVTNAYNQYRYRDRSLIYTYYLQKIEEKESYEEVTESDTISNVQKWVQYVTK